MGRLNVAQLMGRWAGELQLLGDLVQPLTGETLSILLAGRWGQHKLQAEEL